LLRRQSCAGGGALQTFSGVRGWQTVGLSSSPAAFARTQPMGHGAKIYQSNGDQSMRTVILGALIVGSVLVQTPALAARRLQFVDADQTQVAHISQKEDAPGDIMTFKGVLTDPADNKRVGREYGQCIRVDTVDKVWQCSFTFVLTEGQLSIAGAYFDAGESQFAVTGGTGSFEGAKGTMRERARGTNPETYLMTIDLK
jgi:allene oxide cyclase